MLRPVVGRRYLPLALLSVTIWALLTAGCQNEAVDLTTATDQQRTQAIDAARAVLDQVVEATARRDFDALCSYAASLGNCHTQLQGNEATAPTAPPKIECVELVPPKDSRAGGVNFVVSGRDGSGSHYRSDFFVIDTGGGAWKSMTTVYWANIGLADDGPATPRKDETITCK